MKILVADKLAPAGIELLQAWGQDAVCQRLAMLTRRLAAAVADLDVTVLREELRAPHVLSLGFPGGIPAGLDERLRREHVYAAARLRRLRLSPHVYNDEADCDRFAAVLRQAMS